jgi:hypothetical protein
LVRHTTTSKFRLLTYGLPNFEKQNSENVVAQKWRIEFYAVAGCVVTQELEDSVDKHNKTIEPLIEKKYGKNWRDKFYKEVDAEFETEKKVTALIDQLDYIKKRQADMEKEGNGLQYIMTPVANSTKYNVLVQGWGKWKGEDEWMTYYGLLVDYKTRSVKLLSDRIVKE